jgi:DNA-binding transcriptional MerR regulator
MANRRIDPRRIKIHYSYTVKDAADALGTNKNTVRLWIKQGLPITSVTNAARPSSRRMFKSKRAAAAAA